MQSIADVLEKFNPMQDKYVSREFQSFGVYLSEKLDDKRHKSMYIKFSRDIPRSILELALRFVIDSHAKNKAALFMWKLKQLGMFNPKAKGATKKISKTTAANT